MEKEKKYLWACPDAIGFLLCGFYLLLSAPSLMGIVGHEAGLISLPVGIMVILCLIIVVLVCYRNGDLFGAAMNTILGLVLIGSVNIMSLQGFILQQLDVSQTESWKQAATVIDGLSFMVFGLTLLAGGYVIAWKSRFFAFSFWLAGLGMLLMSGASAQLLPTNMFHAGGAMVSQLSLFMLYTGYAFLLNGSLQHTVLPLGRPLFKPAVSNYELE